MDPHQNSVEFDHYVHNGKCSNLQKNGALFTSDTFSYSTIKEKMIHFYNDPKVHGEKPVLVGNITKHLSKKVSKTFINVTYNKNIIKSLSI